MITNETIANLFGHLQGTERRATISVQGPLRNEYKREIFWDKVIKKEPVVIHNTQIIAAATKNMIAGILYEENKTPIIDLILKLAFYVVDGDDANFVYKNNLKFVNLYAPSFDTHNRRKISLVSHGWFEKWNKNDRKAEIYRYLQNSANDECISYWGPWLATTILTSLLDNRTAAEVAQNVDNLFSKLSSLYQGLDFSFPKLDNRFWETFLTRIEITNLDEPKKNCLYWAAINVFHNENTPKTTIDLLNLTIISFLRFRNMELIELIDQFQKFVGCNQCGVLLSSLSVGTLRSWKNYIETAKTYLNPNNLMGKDELWPYARAFDSTVFVNLSYEENFMICNILAVMIDCSLGCWYDYSEVGPTYKKLTSNNHSIYQLNREEFDQCVDVYNLIRRKVRAITINANPAIIPLTL